MLEIEIKKKRKEERGRRLFIKRNEKLTGNDSVLTNQFLNIIFFEKIRIDVAVNYFKLSITADLTPAFIRVFVSLSYNP